MWSRSRSPLSFGASEARRLEVTTPELLSDPARDWRRSCVCVCACACACACAWEAARLLGAGEGSIGALMLGHGEAAAAARLLSVSSQNQGIAQHGGQVQVQGTRMRMRACSG